MSWTFRAQFPSGLMPPTRSFRLFAVGASGKNGATVLLPPSNTTVYIPSYPPRPSKKTTELPLGAVSVRSIPYI